MRRRRAARLSAAGLALTLPLCTAGGGHEAHHFSTSTVTPRDDDLSLSSPLDPPRRPGDDLQSSLGLHRSFIDRDPIYSEEGEGDFISGGCDGHNLMDPHHDPLSNLHEHPHSNQWRSPLERLAPLPSLSLDVNEPSDGSISAIASPVTIAPGMRHPHEIDIHQQQRATTEQPPQLKTRSTGTTIAALLARNSTVLILAADTRATDGSTVADKRCEKLNALARNVWCAGAGTSADVDAMVRKTKFGFWTRGRRSREGCGGVGNMDVSAQDSMAWGTDDATLSAISEEDRDVPPAPVFAVLHSLRTQLTKAHGNLGVNLLAGGYDPATKRATLAAVHPHGSIDVVTNAALGSGGLAATGVLEARYPRIGGGGCSVEEGMRLAVDAVRAGVDNDLGSGSQVDVCVIGEEGVLYRRAIVREEELEWVSVRNKGGEPSERPVEEAEMSAGVNGFGNVPFAIQSKRVVCSGQADVARERRKWLDGVLEGTS
ncbi:hypothetical protein ACHAXT_006557 [Thalassiosira profunda]